MAKRQKDGSWLLGPADLKRFKTGIKYWMEKFGLSHWTIDSIELVDVITVDGREDFEGSHAGVQYDEEYAKADFLLKKVWISLKPTAVTMAKTAHHEVCHILLANLTETGKSRFIQMNQLEKEEHKVISCLQRAHFDDEDEE